jgi:hypothetical protein
MEMTTSLHMIEESNQLQGFANLLRKENGLWWRTNRWWIQVLLWLLSINGNLAFVIWLLPLIVPQAVLSVTDGHGAFLHSMTSLPRRHHRRPGGSRRGEAVGNRRLDLERPRET